MYDDIVASTQPLNYNPALILQKFNYASTTGGYLSRGSSIPGFFTNDLDEDAASEIEPDDYEHFDYEDIPS